VAVAASADPTLGTAGDEQAWSAQDRLLSGGASGGSGVSPTESSTLAPTPPPTPVPMKARYVEAAVTMEVQDPDAACTDDALLSAFREAMAGLVGVAAEDTEATCSVVARRHGSDGGNPEDSIELAERITAPSEEVAGTVVSACSTMPVETLTELIEDTLPAAHPYNLTLIRKSEPTIIVVNLTTATTTTTTTTEADEDVDDSHACGSAALGSAILAVLGATWMFSQ